MSASPLTIPEYREAYASGALTPAAAVSEMFRRIAAHADPAMFISLRGEAELRAEAETLGSRTSEKLPLYGIPVAVKDNIDVAGLPTTCACPDFAYMPAEDAEAVRRLKAAGALVVGKTNLDQFATGLVGVRSPYGMPRNTFRPDIVPGGSSSGSAVAVAAGIVPVALGTDTAGSGRVPAGLNNIVGLKPTLGAISTRGVVPACRTLDCVSVFGLTVEDAWTVFEALAGYDEHDPFSRRCGAPPARGRSGPLVIGVPDAGSRRFGGDPLAEAAFDATLDDLAGLGVELCPVDLEPLFAVAALLYDGPWVAERYQAIRSFIESSRGSLHPVTRAITERASAFSAADAFAGRYRLAELARAAERVCGAVDALAVPTFPRPRTLDELAADPIGPNSELGTYTNFVNLLDLCALAVPGRFRGDDLPAGVTLIAAAGGDAMLARLGGVLHPASRATLGATRRPLMGGAPAIAAPDSGRMEVAVVGAHMSGLPLNTELTALGAELLRRTTTTSDYRLYALARGAVRRPGLLRVANRAGSTIEVEVWSLDRGAFGSFLDGIPAPLTIGTVRLADGTSPKGFLVEAEAVGAAEDVSAHGGWRAYLRTIDP